MPDRAVFISYMEDYRGAPDVCSTPFDDGYMLFPKGCTCLWEPLRRAIMVCYDAHKEEYAAAWLERSGAWERRIWDDIQKPMACKGAWYI